ncbi:hypothetical protein [Clavibacter nebraskensis]|uniref:Uncharacterized protein n=2 Tax=Clavibacter nebraskensis TaxID=31963 RepID=A0A399QM85_9MICO|nr:hypothetical protein [Clavibacter nebraskensis]KXU21102.1 hypothetical protein VV38_05510 [Clavibacter nebraskensis]OAH22381.1 hypothetical protein A3Q38_03050 [Clavibacter nebraskensis]QGV66388.1 hypothetical protein EGX36_05855 [Clavibacter nebraskensis]QGV69186.1 hypothetical protein EGX37_05845 [Clavibacter nebraskensis]QGV71976.1 hypothetical protein EGX35_05845 [Clavibacter nebraskensis]
MWVADDGVFHVEYMWGARDLLSDEASRALHRAPGSAYRALMRDVMETLSDVSDHLHELTGWGDQASFVEEPIPVELLAPLSAARTFGEARHELIHLPYDIDPQWRLDAAGVCWDIVSTVGRERRRVGSRVRRLGGRVTSREHNLLRGRGRPS